MADKIYEVSYRQGPGAGGHRRSMIRASSSEEAARKTKDSNSNIEIVKVEETDHRADGEDKDWTEARLERLEKDEARLREEAPDADREEIREIYAEMQNIAREKKHLGKVVDRAKRRAADEGGDEDEKEEARADKLADWAANRIETLGSEEIKLRRRLAGATDEHERMRLTEEIERISAEIRSLGRQARFDSDPRLAACMDAVDKIARRLDAVAKDCGMDRADAPVSEAQRRAMRAAAAGNSTEGIPKKVGQEFSEKDPGGKLPEHAK